MATDATSARWLAVHTHPQHEALATYHLRRQTYPVVFLHYFTEIRHARRKTTVLRPYFPRYIFAEINDNLPMAPIATTPGVAAIVKSGQEPLQVPKAVIQELSARADPDGLVAPLPARLRPLLAPGEEVSITSGPLQGFPGVVILDDGNRIRLNIKLLGRQIEATVEPGAVTALSPALRSAP
jgi:transcriptional antiterminator RfaH